jgi:hypothetical protein
MAQLQKGFVIIIIITLSSLGIGLVCRIGRLGTKPKLQTPAPRPRLEVVATVPVAVQMTNTTMGATSIVP